MNLQVIASAEGEILWVSGALPGSVHDLTAARIWGIVRRRVNHDRGQGLYRCRRIRPHHVPGPERAHLAKAANRAHAWLRAPGERANARLKARHILRELRCCPWRAGRPAKAMHVLQTREITG
jgi:hypothetical protein